MAAHRINRSNQQQPLPRCRSEGTLLDLNPKVKVPVPPPRALPSDTSSSMGRKQEVIGGEQEVVAIRDYHPGSFTTLRFNRGEHLYVLDTSGADWWFAHNNNEMGYIPAAYVSPLGGVSESSHCSDTVTPLGGVTESSHCSDTVTSLEGVTESSHCSDTVISLGGVTESSHCSNTVISLGGVTESSHCSDTVTSLGGVTESSHCSDTVTSLGGVTESSHCSDTVISLEGVTESSHCSDTVTSLGGVTESSHCSDTVTPLGGVTESSHCSDTVTPLGGVTESSHCSDTVTPLGGVTESSHCSDTVISLEGVTESSHCSDTVTSLGGVTESSHCSNTVISLGGLTGSSHLSDSGMICDSVESDDWLLGEWAGLSFKDTLPPSPNRNPFNVNPFLNGGISLDQSFVNRGISLDQSLVNRGSSLDQSIVNRGISLDERVRGGRKSTNLITFDPLPLPHSEGNCDTNAGVSSGPTAPSCGPMQNNTLPDHRDSPFLRSKRSFSLSELSVLQAQSNPVLPSSGFFPGLSAPAPDQFGSRAQYRTAWLNHRKLARSCHDLCSLGQNPGWGQTQPVETHTVCCLDANGGVVQLPDTHVSVHVPAGHVAPGDHQHIALKALLEPPVELNTDLISSVSPVLEIKLSNMDTNTFITLEMKVNVTLKRDGPDGGCSAEVLCVRSNSREGPYAPIPNAYVYKDTVQARLDRPEPCTYVAVVVRAVRAQRHASVWDHIQKTVTLGLYGPKHIHPSFKAVAAMFAHDCSPKTLLVNEVGGAGQAGSAPPVVLHLWGKHQFVLRSPQDLQVGLYSNMSQYEVQVGDGGPSHGGPSLGGPSHGGPGDGSSRVIRGFQLKLGKVIRHVFCIVCQSDILSDFTLRVQVKDALGCILAQFCVQTPPPPPSGQMRSCSHQRRFLRKTEMKNKIMLSPVAASCKYPRYQDRHVTNLKFCRLIKTVKRQHKSATYLLEYKKGDVMALLSEDKITLRGNLWTKEWYVGFYHGRVGLVHVKNVVVLGKVKPVYWSGPDLTSSILLEQILKPCKFLTYIYASVRTLLMENVSSWRMFADALGYRDVPLSFFCRVEVDGEPERVASVLEKLKEDCTSSLDLRERRNFQRELMMALLKMDCQGLVSRLLCDCVLLTTAVEVSSRWRELADKLCRVSSQQMEAYEAPHRDQNGTLDSEAMWKPAYDFLVTWASSVGDSYRDVLQELHVGLDRMRNPPTRTWRHLTGTLVMVHCLEPLRCTAFCPDGDHLDLPV